MKGKMKTVILVILIVAIFVACKKKSELSSKAANVSIEKIGSYRPFYNLITKTLSNDVQTQVWEKVKGAFTKVEKNSVQFTSILTEQLNDLDIEKNLILSKKKIPRISNLLLITESPIKITKLVEKINIEYLKQKFNQQSEIKIKKYIINLNSRELILGNNNLKLTEKETNIIIYLSKFSKPIKIDELQLKVWGYHSELETHTVETHIYRLRKKILNFFNDKSFIISKKNGYQIN